MVHISERMISFRYIEENYSKIRDVERELANLSMEMKLTAGPKKAGWCFIMTSCFCVLNSYLCVMLSELFFFNLIFHYAVIV